MDETVAPIAARRPPNDPEAAIADGADTLLFATTPAGSTAAALLALEGETILGRLVGQLTGNGARAVRVVTRPAWLREVENAVGERPGLSVVASPDVAGDLRLVASEASSAEGALVVAAANLTAHETLVADLARGGGTRVLTRPGDARRSAAAIRISRGLVAAAASSYHRVGRPDGQSLAALRVHSAARPRVAAAATELAGLSSEAADDDVVRLLLVGLVRSGEMVRAQPTRGFVATAPGSDDEAREAAAALASSDEDCLRLAATVKQDDAFFASFFATWWTKHLARAAVRVGVSANAVTLASFAAGLGAAAALAVGTRPWLVAGALLLQLSFVLDCVDGQIARYTRTFSPLGAWMDVVFDRVNEILVFAALAVGSGRGWDRDAWVLACVAVTLLVVRHLGDFAWVAQERSLAPRAPGPPLLQVEDDAPPVVVEDGAVSALRRSAVPKWAHRVVRFPVGERLFLLSVVAAVATPRAALVAYCVWAGLAWAYTIAGRIAKGHAAGGRMLGAALR